MVSINTDKCNTPRPNTINLSALPVCSTLKAKFFSNSFSKRSLICLEVTNFPSFPKKGESLIVNNILMVGSSIAMVARLSGFSISQTESPISKPSKPTKAQISPAFTSATFFLPKPSKVCSSLILVFTILPSRFTKEICIFSFKIPRCNLPIAILPVKEE